MLKQIYLAATVSWLFLLQACGQSNAGAYDLMLKGMYKNTVPQITPGALKQQLQNDPSVVLLDTRSAAEYKLSYIKGARFTDYNNLNLDTLASLPKSTPVIVYCSVGYRSERVGEKLQEAGFTNVQNLHGGIFKWVNAGEPVYNAKGQTRQVHAYSKGWGIWLQKGEKVYDKE